MIYIRVFVPKTEVKFMSRWCKMAELGAHFYLVGLRCSFSNGHCLEVLSSFGWLGNVFMVLTAVF